MKKLFIAVIVVLILNISACKSEDSNPSATVAKPSVPSPVLLFPGNNSADMQLSPVLSWESYKGAKSYKLIFSTDISLKNKLVDTANLKTNSFKINGLDYEKKYYWQVKVIDSTNNLIESDIWNFSTVAKPKKPVLSSPVNNSTEIPLSSTVSWNAYPGTKTYALQVSENSSFLNCVFDKSGITGTACAISGLNGTTKYYWRIKAIDSSGSYLFSDTWSFSTIDLTKDVSSFSYSYTKSKVVKGCSYSSYMKAYMVVQCDVYTSYFNWSCSDSRVTGVLIVSGSFTPENGKKYTTGDWIWVMNSPSGNYNAGEIITVTKKFSIYTFDKNYVYSKGIVKDQYVPERYCYNGWSSYCGL